MDWSDASPTLTPITSSTYPFPVIGYVINYDINIPGFDPSICYNMAILTDAELDECTPDFTLWSGIDPTVNNVWVSTYPSSPNPKDDVLSTGVQEICPCNGENPPVPCNSDFTFELESNTKESYGTAILYDYHAGSTYLYDWGDGHTSAYPESVIYTPGIYTICVTETTFAGKVCKSCIQICVADPAPTVVTGVAVSPQPDSTACNSDFIFKFEADTGGAVASGTILISYPNPTSTYIYDWGDGHTSAYPESVIYAPGSYRVCVTEMKANGSYCTTCFNICVVDAEGGISNSFKKSNDNTITGNNNAAIENKITLSPNPTRTNANLTIELLEESNVKVTIVDMTGKKVADVYSGILKEGVQKLNINTDNFASGLYQVQVMIGNKMSTHKLSVIK